MSAELPVNVWTERIDDSAIAVSASCIIRHRGWIRGHAIFFIALRTECQPAWKWHNFQHWRQLGVERFTAELTPWNGFLPYICRVDEAPAYL